MNPEEREVLSELFVRLASGDRSALAAAYQALRPAVQAIAQKLLVHGADAEDATEEALIKVFERINQFDVERDPLTWALTIAVWECRSFRRQRQRHHARQHDYDDALHAHRDTPETIAINNEQRAALEQLIARLTPQQQQAIAALLADEGSGEVAQRKRKQRAIAQLQRWWEMFHGDA